MCTLLGRVCCGAKRSVITIAREREARKRSLRLRLDVVWRLLRENGLSDDTADKTVANRL